MPIETRLDQDVLSRRWQYTVLLNLWVHRTHTRKNRYIHNPLYCAVGFETKPTPAILKKFDTQARKQFQKAIAKGEYRHAVFNKEGTEIIRYETRYFNGHIIGGNDDIKLYD
jgi:hypothetical protein